jgi:hypothetical protein
MPTFDKDKFAKYLRTNVLNPKQYPFGRGECAKHVRMALMAVDIHPATWPWSAKDWGATLIRLGFREIPQGGYVAQLGDITVIQPPSHEGKQYGHMAGYDGSAWVSDFVQRDFWPGPGYRTEKPAYVIYRWPF